MQHQLMPSLPALLLSVMKQLRKEMEKVTLFEIKTNNNTPKCSWAYLKDGLVAYRTRPLICSFGPNSFCPSLYKNGRNTCRSN